LAVGAGFSAFNPDWGNGRMDGGGLWFDYTPSRMPGALDGIGIEVEAHDISINSRQAQPFQREDSAGGGLIYSWRHLRNFRPYGKFLAGFGNCEYDIYPKKIETRYHQTRSVYSLGGGFEYHLTRSFWARADYEHQSWPDFFKHASGTSAGQLNPQGFTVGVSYHFARPRVF
jgi:opacity protein-like surface antigen